MKKFAVILFALVLCGLPSLKARTWTSLDGKTMEGELVKADKGGVTIRRSDGVIFTVDVEKFSEADQKFVAQETQKNPSGEMGAAPAPTGKIRSPKDGEKVESGFTVKGLTRDVPKGFAALLFTSVPGSTDMSPRQETLEANRSFNTNIYHGPTDKGEWGLHLFVLPEAAAKQLAAWHMEASKMAALGQLAKVEPFDKSLLEKAVKVASIKYNLVPQ